MKDSRLKRKLVEIYEFIYEKHRILVLRIKYRLRIMNSDKTINYIIKHHCSIARYGDGEFDMIAQTRNLHFQPISDVLSKKLINVLDKKNSNLLLCVPRCFNTTRGCNQHSKDFWIEWGKRNNHHQEIVKMIRSHTGIGYVFGDSQITRPYIDWIDDRRAKRTFPKLKKIWAERNIIIIEGEQTRLGVGNDLFDGAVSVKRILAPAIGAFDYYNELKETILRNYHGELLLIALGPTATVLASDFADMGIQALDIGNIDIEYEWYLRGAKTRIAIQGKFTNESKDGRTFSECKDSKYLSEIIAKVGC